MILDARFCLLEIPIVGLWAVARKRAPKHLRTDFDTFTTGEFGRKGTPTSFSRRLINIVDMVFELILYDLQSWRSAGCVAEFWVSVVFRRSSVLEFCRTCCWVLIFCSFLLHARHCFACWSGEFPLADRFLFRFIFHLFLFRPCCTVLCFSSLGRMPFNIPIVGS